MPITHQIDRMAPLVRVDLGLKVPHLLDVRRALDDLAEDPLFRPGLSVVVDGGPVYINRAFERDCLLLLAARVRLNADTRRWAFLTSNLATYRQRELAEMYAESLGIEYRVFIRRRDAVNWALSLAGACSA